MSSHDNKYQENTKNKEPGELAIRLINYIPPSSTVLDLGAGAGVDSRYFVDNGHYVTAIDRETAVISEIIESPDSLHAGKINVIQDDFYHMNLPICDVIYANYSLPFCETAKFPDQWLKLESQIKIGAIIAFVFFGKNDDWNNNTDKYTFHSTEDVLSLLKNYEIMHLVEKEYDGKSMRPNGEIVQKHWNVIEVIAKKRPKKETTKTAKVAATFFEGQDDFRAWLEAHHDIETELIVGYYKVKSGKPSMTWSESVDQALCFGWIDGVRKTIDHESYSIRFTPRRKTSVWSTVNINKVEALKKLGLMKPEGLKAYSYRTDSNSEIYTYENEQYELSLDFENKFKQDEVAWDFFNKQAPSYKRVIKHWIMSAKQEKTRQSRLDKVIHASGQFRRV